jgi:hypothetical protein
VLYDVSGQMGQNIVDAMRIEPVQMSRRFPVRAIGKKVLVLGLFEECALGLSRAIIVRLVPSLE